jgi:hypothetical protein
MTDQCSVDGCEREAFYKEAGLCQACYQGLYYWQRYRTPTEVIRRKHQLGVLDARMKLLSTHRRKRR